MLENKADKYEFIWGFNNPEEYKDIIALSKAKIVKFKSIRYIYYAITAKYRITNAEEWIVLPKRQGQIYLNLWHGMPFKKIALDAAGVKNKLSGLDYYTNTDVFISSSTQNSRIYRTAFAYDGNVCETGMPRNDFLINMCNDNNMRMEILTKLELDQDVNYCLYAPTFREVGNVAFEKMHGDSVLKALKIRFGGEWKFLLRKHTATAYGIGCADFFSDITSDFIDVTEYPDMQELMFVSSVLITDYSSTIWDFSFLERPMFSYAPDVDEYENSERGFYEPTDKWGVPICCDNYTLVNEIVTYDDVLWKEKREQMRQIFGNMEQGRAAETIIMEVFADGENKKII